MCWFGRMQHIPKNHITQDVWSSKNHHLAIKLKIKVYTARILSVLLYSSPAQCFSFQMPSLHSWCLVEGSCPQLHHPVSRRFI